MRLGKDDILVIKAVLLYILTHSNDGQRDIYSLVKTAYYAQQNHLAQYGTPLSRIASALCRSGRYRPTSTMF